jgi:hypothetical protein
MTRGAASGQPTLVLVIKRIARAVAEQVDGEDEQAEPMGLRS